MKLIPLSTKEGCKNKGKYFAMVDDDDFERVVKYNWAISMQGKKGNLPYATRADWNKGNERRVSLHRFIMGLQHNDGKMVDHKDMNGLNCQKCNMRICTHSQNMQNKKSWGISKYKGVSLQQKKINNKTYTYWRASLQKDGKTVFHKTFKTEVAAARAYSEAALMHFGKGAKINTI